MSVGFYDLISIEMPFKQTDIYIFWMAVRLHVDTFAIGTEIQETTHKIWN